MKRGDVTESAEELWIIPYQVEIEGWEQPVGAPPSTGCEDTIDIRIDKHVVQILQALMVTTGKVAVAISHKVAELHVEPKIIHHPLHTIKFTDIVDDTCRSRDA